MQSKVLIRINGVDVKKHTSYPWRMKPGSSKVDTGYKDNVLAFGDLLKPF
jgi:hypothetical protein